MIPKQPLLPANYKNFSEAPVPEQIAFSSTSEFHNTNAYKVGYCYKPIGRWLNPSND